MSPLLRAAALLLALLSACAQAIAAPRPHRPRAVSVPVFLPGVGRVWISAHPASGRRR